MDVKEFFIYLLIMAGSTYLIRVIPFVLIRKKIKNEFINSFLYYIPYTVLTAMTFPAAIFVTGHIISAILGLIASCILAIKGKSLTVVACVCCLVVLACELIFLII
jgi:branched-subunit amino acid transport protein